MKKFVVITIVLCFFTNVWAYTQSEVDSAFKLADQGVIKYHTSEYSYRLNSFISRKEFIKVFWNLQWKEIEDTCWRSFSDVENDWSCKYIFWALKNNFIAANQFFRPHDNITKWESLKLILKARGISRQFDTWDWRQDDMKTALIIWIVKWEYNDFNSYADRWWIFEIAATEIGAHKKLLENNNPYLVP